MKIVLVGPFAMEPKRTMAVRALPLGKALAARGHQVVMLLPPWDHPQDAGKKWVEDGVYVHNVQLPAPIPLWQHIVLTWRLLQATWQHHPDVIHCFKPKSYAGLVAWAIWQWKRTGKMKAQLVIDTDDWEGPGGWNELGHYSWAQKRFFSWQERWGLTHCDAVTVASRALETIVWSLGMPVTRVYYLPNGWWPDEHAATPEEIAILRQKYGFGDAPVALLYTRFFEYRLERALAIMQAVLAHMPETHWLIVGKGLFGEEAQLLAMARERGIASHITYAGWVPPEQLPAHFALAQVAIYPFDDTLINRTKCAVKLIDLLAAGVPVVADRVGQNAEYIEHGVSGLLVPPDEPECFIDAVVNLLRDPTLASRLGKAGQARIRSDFSWQKLAQQVEKVYQSQS